MRRRCVITSAERMPPVPRLRPGSRIAVHQVALEGAQRILLSGIPVASVDAVAMSLAFAAHRDEESARWLRALLEVVPGLGTRTHDAIGERPRAPGKRAALALLAEPAGQEVVTR
ncbi:hypothetical protein L2X99_05140 [Microbacterium sp. KUDC0406]|uniref:hypothetical protein n=1 Tax=Microbacterium sp. KUDC0406 TaxID=2909588 RepID=UPI001F3996F1|nr:hypothetical protein [Microbacterium sp. KUDC0406]UJP10985.1 hypothetical protein L2X99_05140 [Microbacterium sp. KUDC0406]